MSNPKRTEELPKRRRPPGKTLEARENQLIALAFDLAEKQLSEGTASSQVITEFLKRGSAKDRIERDILTEQRSLIKAKTENLKSVKKVEELYANALNAMRSYSGQEREDVDDY